MLLHCFDNRQRETEDKMLNERDNLIDKICKMECWTNIDWTVKFDYQIVLDTEQNDPYRTILLLK